MNDSVPVASPTNIAPQNQLAPADEDAPAIADPAIEHPKVAFLQHLYNQRNIDDKWCKEDCCSHCPFDKAKFHLLNFMSLDRNVSEGTLAVVVSVGRPRLGEQRQRKDRPQTSKVYSSYSHRGRSVCRSFI